ncbi:MAG: hypothetical protein H6869_09360 [Rhodospirillales bacterium]|nr:hypothetical protein [Rhodospirillales bacterium]
MENLVELYARYDGPPPRSLPYTTSPACWEMMLCRTLRAIRLQRHHAAWDALPALCAQARQIHVYLRRPMV